MLRITVPTTELWDERNETFITLGKDYSLQLEHSLVSLSKWESKWHKPFLSKEKMTIEETLDYIRCMTLTQNVPPEVYYALTDDNIAEINAYIEAPMTALRLPKEKKGTLNRETITSELIYYWMITLNIPIEFQKWHLNKLLSLIKLCNIKNAPPKKMGKEELMRRNAELNAIRRAQFNSKG